MVDTKLKDLLEKSDATESFKRAVRDFSEGKDSKLIQYSSGSPKIKVLRVLMKLLDECREEPITEVDIQGASSCSSYLGTLTFGPNNGKIAFNWDCAWKAKQEGLKTWYGAPDQMKAARLFGYQCFERFETIK